MKSRRVARGRREKPADCFLQARVSLRLVRFLNGMGGFISMPQNKAWDLWCKEVLPLAGTRAYRLQGRRVTTSHV